MQHSPIGEDNMALVSPGVEVNVIDESFYTPAGAGTVPIIFIATAENKTSASGSGTAVGTLKANAGKPYLITSQRELGDTFGDALFYSDTNGNMIHGGELNEYGLNTAYSLLGVSNRVYVCRADLDTTKLQAKSVAPGGEPVDGSYWLDTRVTSFGALEWNGSAITVSGGQSFTSVSPIAIVDATQLVDETPGEAPKASVGAVGDYAVDTTATDNKLWYKAVVGPSKGQWVGVGTVAWKASWATVTGTNANPTITDGLTITVDGTLITQDGTSLNAFVTEFNLAMTADGVTCANVDGFLEIYSENDTLVIAPGTGGSSTLITQLGLTAGTFNTPAVAIAPHTSVPTFKTLEDNRPTGSLWLKTTQPNAGAVFNVKRYNGDTQLWERVIAPVYQTAEDAIYQLNRTGGGANLVLGDLYVKANINEDLNKKGNWTIYRRAANGPTTVVSQKITSGKITAGTYDFTIAETRTGNNRFWPRNSSTNALEPVTVTFTATGAPVDATTLAGAINAAGLVNVLATVDGLNRVSITHKLGGEIKLVDSDGGLALAGFGAYVDPTEGTPGVSYEPGTDNTTSPSQFRVSGWRVLSYVADDDEPLTLAPDGELWYSSVVDEIDVMIHNGTTWVGYLNYDHGDGTGNTDPNGPIVGATEPTTQSNGDPLVTGDLWIDTADIENFPTIYKYNDILEEWVLVDKTDQTTENGVLFADARYGVNGGDVNTGLDAGDIVDLLSTNYLDADAPDPALYPKGMLLWNLRRSGFNVKRFVRNYIDVNQTNSRYLDQPMDAYYPHRWVTDSGNREDGAGTFGRHAQRKSVVQALQALVNSNQDIRDEESRFFNLIACPGYPELIGEMITLNYDRRLTAFVVGDTPARLTPDATSLNEWGANVRRAVEDNDDGAVSFDEYMAMYYPWGFTSDNAGNNVVVPPSHMALRTIILNDQVAFPWFAPAGTRRGGVTNATASGYINSEGEFVSIALNTGQRDTLYSNSINPITFLSGAGLVVFGQKTRARNASALDRVNVARLIVYMRGQLEKLARPYLFEPNDKITRDQIKAAADAFCLELVSLRALYDYLVVCDESNNTPSRIDRNELYLDIAIEPVKAVEFIYIPLRIKNTGEIAALG
jgi:hypothetical protein